MRHVQPCGTFGAYKRHIRAPENPCGPCLEAGRDYFRQLRASTPRSRSLSRLWASGDFAGVLHTINERASFDGKCDVWHSRNASGYARTQISGKQFFVYRLVMGAKRCVKLEPHEVVHHTCGRGTSGCVTVEHLQIVDRISNVAEMLDRRAYEAQIVALTRQVAELEARVANCERVH